jgi:Carboxypeptidase regulatory-like domain/Ankyrin repeats (3 copies)
LRWNGLDPLSVRDAAHKLREIHHSSAATEAELSPQALHSTRNIERRSPMSPKDSIPQLNLISPCQVDWDQMIGNDRIRFCEHCQLSVHNQVYLSKKQLRRLLARTQGRLCVRFAEPVVVTPPALFKIGRRASALVAGAFSASLSVSTALAGSLDLNQCRVSSRPGVLAPVSLSETAVASTGGTIKGCVFDPNSALIIGAYVTLTDGITGEVTFAISDASGEFKFEGLKAGTYNLKIAARGFSTTDVLNIVLRDNDETKIDQTLSIAAIEETVEVNSPATERFVATAGAVAIVSPTEPLVKAANEDDINALQEVLREKPDANVRDASTDMTALECAVRNANRDMIHVLLWAKANVNAKDNGGQTVLMMLGETITEEIVWDLLNAGAKVNQRDNDGDTPLISAASSNNLVVVKTLLDAGAKVNAANNEGRTALMMAADAGLVNNLRTLLMAGAQIDARDKQNKTALMLAKENNHTAAVRLLKSFGAVEFAEPDKDKQ